jgi:hypothetical protein
MLLQGFLFFFQIPPCSCYLLLCPPEVIAG